MLVAFLTLKVSGFLDQIPFDKLSPPPLLRPRLLAALPKGAGKSHCGGKTNITCHFCSQAGELDPLCGMEEIT